MLELCTICTGNQKSKERYTKTKHPNASHLIITSQRVQNAWNRRFPFRIEKCVNQSKNLQRKLSSFSIKRTLTGHKASRDSGRDVNPSVVETVSGVHAPMMVASLAPRAMEHARQGSVCSARDRSRKKRQLLKR